MKIEGNMRITGRFIYTISCSSWLPGVFPSNTEKSRGSGCTFIPEIAMYPVADSSNDNPRYAKPLQVSLLPKH